MAKVSYHPERGSDEDTVQFGYTFEAGKETEVPDSDPHLSTFRENMFFRVSEGKEEKPAETGLKAVHNGGGRFVIKRDGETIKDGLNKADADAFNALSDEDKAAYVEE